MQRISPATTVGSIEVPFFTLFASTVKTHGVRWAWQYYSKRGMQRWEFRIWCLATMVYN